MGQWKTSLKQNEVKLSNPSTQRKNAVKCRSTGTIKLGLDRRCRPS